MFDERILRILTVLRLIQTGRPNVNALAAYSGKSRRTIFRDIEKLRNAGIPIVFDSERQAFSLTGDFYLPPTQFTPDEALAMIVLCFEMNENSQLPYFQAAKSAALKIVGVMPPPLLEKLKNIGPALKLRTSKSMIASEQGKRHFDQLLDAYSNRKAIRIRYGSPAEPEEMQTLLFPYQILFSRHAWYVIGRSSLHRQTRTFHIGRISQIETTDTVFQVPIGFSLERYLRNAWHLIPEPGRDIDVTIRFSPKVAKNVSEILWHKTQKISPRNGGGIDFHVTVSGLHEISWWILGYGMDAEAIQPEPLRQMISLHVEGMKKMYQDEPTRI